MVPIVAVNPGSTSTKIALFEGASRVYAESFLHDSAELKNCASVWDQFDFRWDAVRGWCDEHVRHVTAVASVGGLFRPVQGGAYRVNERMRADARANYQGEHASNLGCELAWRLAGLYQCPAFVVDPVSVDEFEPLARYSGHPLIMRRSLSHALNIHAAARGAAMRLGKSLSQVNAIVAHLGGGISIAPVRGGRIIDVNDASSDGPFSPERSGGLPLQPFIDLCFDGCHAASEVRRMVMGQGGLAAYLGTNSAVEVERLIDSGDSKALEVYQAMAYQIAKEIGAMSTVLDGAVDAIVLTGGLASSALLVNWIQNRVGWIAPVFVVQGEDEMLALAEGVLRVLGGGELALDY